MSRRFGSVLAIALWAVAPSGASAVVLYSDDFNSDTSANYNTFVTAGATGPSGDSTFVYNYAADPSTGGLAIPVAPHTTDSSTVGLRVRTDNLQNSVGTVVGATEVVTKNLTLPSAYKVQVDVWSNYIGGTNISASGSNGSTGAAVGIGTAGTAIQYLNVANDGLQVEAFGDNGGGADGAYRVYPGTTSPRPVPTNSSYYAAGTTAGSATFSNAYYTAPFPSVSAAPAAQVTFAPTTQGGSTAAGTLGFAWHTWTIVDDGTNIKWSIDNTLITTVPVTAVTLHGSQVSLANVDTGLTGNTAANNQLFNAQIFDNLIITDLSTSTPGDFNNDGKVDAADYVSIRQQYSDITTGAGLAAYSAWRANFGAGSGAGLVTGNVPEPSTLLLTLGVICCGCMVLRRR
jgi:hypothetical protein